MAARAQTWLLALALILLGVLTYQVQTLRAIVLDIAHRIYLVEVPKEQKLTRTTTWTTGGTPHSVTTTRRPNETVAAFYARHDADVATAQATYPPD